MTKAADIKLLPLPNPKGSGMNWTEEQMQDFALLNVLYHLAVKDEEMSESKQPAAVDDAMVERATMALLGKSHDTAPGIDWRCDRAWTVNKVRKNMRAALTAALAEQTAAVVGVEQVASAIAIEDTGVSWHDVSPRDRAHYVKLARAALAAQQGGEVHELRLCESSRLFLRPDRLYRFTVDPDCSMCREAASYYAQQGGDA